MRRGAAPRGASSQDEAPEGRDAEGRARLRAHIRPEDARVVRAEGAENGDGSPVRANQMADVSPQRQEAHEPRRRGEQTHEQRAWGATRRGGRGDLWLAKGLVLKRLHALRRGRAYHAEETRVAHVQAVLQEAALRRAAVVTVPRETLQARLTGLPAGVTIEPREIRITFETSEEAGARVVALLQALTADWRQFQAFVDQRE